MITKNKVVNQISIISNILPDKTNIPQKIKENQHLSFSYIVSHSTSHTPMNLKKKKLNQIRKKVGFSDFSPAILLNKIKTQDYSHSITSKTVKPFFALLSKNKNLNHMSIKTLGNYIKQKILDMSADLGKDNKYFSDIENNSNCNIRMPFTSMNKIIKKFKNENGQKTPAHLINKK